MRDTIKLYLSDLNRSPATVSAYGYALTRLADFVENKPISAFSPDDVIGYVRSLRPLSRNTVAAYTNHTMVFMRWLVLERVIDMSLGDLERLKERLRHLRGKSNVRTLPPIMSDAAVMALLSQAYNAPGHTPRLALLRLRNIALIETLRSTGARVSEVVDVRYRDLGHERKTAVVIGKGQVQRVIFFDASAWDALMDYISARDGLANGAYLFVRHDRSATGTESLSTTSVRNTLNHLATGAEIDEAIRPHLFRHRFATKVLAATGNLAATQDMLGHASPETTRVYAQITGAGLQSMHEGVNL